MFANRSITSLINGEGISTLITHLFIRIVGKIN